MPLAEPRDDRLVRLGVVVRPAKRRILVVQPMESQLQLLLVGAIRRRARPSDTSGSGKSICGRRTGCSRVDSVSFVCVLRSLATQPMSPAWRRGTSMRSRPCATERWFSFSAPPRVALNSSSPLAIVPEKRRKNVTSPTCGSDVVLKTCAANGASSFAWISTVVSPSAPLKAWTSSISYAFGISSTIVDSTACVP